MAQDMGAAVPFDHSFSEVNPVIMELYFHCANRAGADRLAEVTRLPRMVPILPCTAAMIA